MLSTCRACASLHLNLTTAFWSSYCCQKRKRGTQPMATPLASDGGGIWTQVSDFLEGTLWVMNKDKRNSDVRGHAEPCSLRSSCRVGHGKIQKLWAYLFFRNYPIPMDHSPSWGFTGQVQRGALGSTSDLPAPQHLRRQGRHMENFPNATTVVEDSEIPLLGEELGPGEKSEECSWRGQMS